MENKSSDESLDIGVLPWTAGRSENFVNAHPFGGLLKLVPIAAVAVTEQIARCTIPGESFEKLSRGPFFSWIGSNSKMNRTSAVMVKNDEDEQEFKGDGWDDEEVSSNKVLSMILEKGPVLRKNDVPPRFTSSLR